MNAKSVFDQYANKYDHWFDENERIYQAEIKALKQFIPKDVIGIEIGVGTGRFSMPLGIKIGIDPSLNMLVIARKRDIATCQGVGEFLPFCDGKFDFALLVTVVCFVENLALLFREVKRVIKPGGRIIVGFINKNSDLGKKYESSKDTNVFYKEALFYSVSDIRSHLLYAGFGDFKINQTILEPLKYPKAYQVQNGNTKGAFVTISGMRE